MITHYVAGERACLLLMLAVCTPLQQSSQGPCENEMLGAETCDAEELLGVALPDAFSFLKLKKR